MRFVRSGWRRYWGRTNVDGVFLGLDCTSVVDASADDLVLEAVCIEVNVMES